MNYLFENKKQAFVFIAIIALIAINYNVVLFGLDSDFFGVVFSIFLFVFGAKTTNFKVNYYLIPMLLLFEFVCFRLHLKSLHFLTIAVFICWVYYLFTKKFSFVAFICLLLFSTLFNKLFEHLTTEIKQTLCNWSFLTLKNIIEIDRIEGVNFYMKNAKITIDTACMGLSMFKTGLLFGAILLTIEEKKQQKTFSILKIIAFCLLVIALNVLSNYFRIIILILAKCTQENFLHHAIGIACFIFYQIIPMLFLIKYFKPNIQSIETKTVKTSFVALTLIFIGIICTSFEMKNKHEDNILENINEKYDIKNGVWVNPEVFKINKNDTLVYIKTPSHKPLICWTGSGYKITETKKIKIKNEEIWFNKMEKNHIFYHSYWWYESGNQKYTSLVEVLFMKLIYNKPTRLINETVVVSEI